MLIRPGKTNLQKENTVHGMTFVVSNMFCIRMHGQNFPESTWPVLLLFPPVRYVQQLLSQYREGCSIMGMVREQSTGCAYLKSGSNCEAGYVLLRILFTHPYANILLTIKRGKQNYLFHIKSPHCM